MLLLLANAARKDLQKQLLLEEFLTKERDAANWELLLAFEPLRTVLLEIYPDRDSTLSGWVVALMDELPAMHLPFETRMETLQAAKSWMPDDRRQELSCWLRVRDRIRELNELQETPCNLLGRLTGVRRRLVEQFAESLTQECARLVKFRSWTDPVATFGKLLTINCHPGSLQKSLLSTVTRRLGGSVKQKIRNRPVSTQRSSVAPQPPVPLPLTVAPQAASAPLQIAKQHPSVTVQAAIPQPAVSSPSSNIDSMPQQEGGKDKRIVFVAWAATFTFAVFLLSTIYNFLVPAPQERLAKIDAAKSDAVRIETIEPEGAKPNATKPAPTKPKLAKNEGTKPAVVKNEGAKPAVVKNEGTKPAPKDPASKPIWTPDKLYIAETDNAEFTVARRFWKFENPVDFLTYHGPSVYDSDDVPKEFKSKKHVPLIRRWKDLSTIEVFAAIPDSDGVVYPNSEKLVWTVRVEKPEGGNVSGVAAVLTETNQIAWKTLESADQSRIEASLRNCAIGIHTGKDTKVLAVERKKPDSPLSATLTKDSEVQFDLPSAVEIPSASRYIFALDGNSAIRFAPNGHAFFVGDGIQDLYSTEWTLHSWPKNGVAPKGFFKMKDSIPILGVKYEYHFAEDKKPVKADITLRNHDTNRMKFALAYQGLQASYSELKKLSPLPTDKLNIAIAQLRLAKLKSLDTYCRYFGVEPLRIGPLSGKDDDFAKWASEFNSELKRIKNDFDSIDLKAEEAAIILLRDAFGSPLKQIQLEGRVHIVVDGKVTEGKVTHGIAIIVGAFGDS